MSGGFRGWLKTPYMATTGPSADRLLPTQSLRSGEISYAQSVNCSKRSRWKSALPNWFSIIVPRLK